MFPTGLSTIAALAALFLSVFAVVAAFKAMRIAAQGCARSVSLQKLTAIEADLTETHQLIEGLRKSLHKMRSRERVNRVRNEPAAPDPSDPVAYKRALRAELTKAGRLNGRFHMGAR